MSKKYKLEQRLDKFKKLFIREQKENLFTEDGRRNLYFDKECKNYIKFFLSVKTTCSNIFQAHREEIKNKLKEMKGEEQDLNSYSFFIIELSSAKKSSQPNLIDLKIEMNDSFLFNTLQNPKLILCYFPFNKYSNDYKKKVRNEEEIYPTTNDENEEVGIKDSKIKRKNKPEIYLEKTIIYYYNEKNMFSKEKIKVTEKQIEIKYNNQKIKILIKDIKEMKLLTMNDTESEIEQFFKDYIIIGDRPKYCLQLIKFSGEKILIGRNTFEYFVALTKAIESASIHYHNCFSNSSFDGIIIRENSGLFATFNILVKNSFNIIDLIVNKEKRKIFLKDFKEKKLQEIVEKIIEYKSCFKRSKYTESIHKIIHILGIIEKMTKEERDNYEKIINKGTIDKLVDINNKIKEIWDVNSNIDKDESKVKELKKIINLYTFDDLFVEIKDEYISSYYDELKNDKKYPQIKQNFKLILGSHFIDLFGMNKKEDFQFLGTEDVEIISKNVTDEENKYRDEKSNALFI